MNPDARLLDRLRTHSVDLERATSTISADDVRRAAKSPPMSRRSKSWQFAVGGFATALVISLAIALVSWALSSDDETETIAGAVKGPERILAITADGRLVSMRAEDGREVRVITEGISPGVGEGQSLQLAPDGSASYFLQATDTTCAGGPLTDVVRADLRTGEIETIATNARWPALSPNGRFLAFTGIPNCSEAGQSIFVFDTATGESNEFTTAAWVVRAGIGYLSWAPDSRHLLFAPFDAPEGSFPRVLDTESDAPLDASPLIPNPDGSRVEGHLGSTGQLLGTRAPGVDEPQQLGVVTFDPVSGEIKRRLFRFPEECCGQTVTSDATGRHVLAVGVSSALYRWSVGDRDPRRIADEIVAAAWFPDHDGFLEIRVLAGLRYDRDDYTVEGGVIQISFVSEGGSHVLVFGERRFGGLKLVTQGGGADVGKVRLEPGLYTVFCDIPGHRQAGEEATITVVPAARPRRV